MRNNGFTLIETMIALLILALTSSAIIYLNLIVNSTLNSARNRNIAISTSQKALEEVRGYYQANKWSGLLYKISELGSCFSDGTLETKADNCTPSPVIGNSTFSLLVSLNYDGTKVRAVASTSWVEKGKNQNVSLDTYFLSY